MESIQETVIEQLNHLITMAEDGKAGYETAAKDVEEVELKNLFLNLAQERALYTRQLQLQVNMLNGNAENSGGPVGAIHRLWMDVKSTFMSDKETILNACITGEEAAIGAYKSVLTNTTLSESVRQLLTEQIWGIERAWTDIKLRLPKAVV